jgi:quercetin dioxygenase-like cupin family protein
MKPHNINGLKGTFFKLVDQTSLSQIGVMTLQPNQTSGGIDTHPGDQVVYIIEGQGLIVIEEKEYSLGAGGVIIVPANCKHQIINNSKKELFVLSIYTPPAY